MANLPIGYYAHHHGTGHMMRAQEICARIDAPVFLFSSKAPFQTLPAHVTYVPLELDNVNDYHEPQSSAFFYTPYAPQVLSRYKRILDTIKEHNIQAMYVDVSVEVAEFAKIIGLKVGFAVMHGQRNDSVHTHCYDAVDFLLSHNSQVFDTPANRYSSTPLYYSGGISRYKKEPSEFRQSIQQVLVTTSKQSSSINLDDVNRTAKDFPDIMWRVVGATKGMTDTKNVELLGIVDDMRPVYGSADLIIGTGGNNTIMEVASQQKPFICIPDVRAFSEQKEAAKALARLNAAFYEETWPSKSRWQELFKIKDQLDLETFHGLVDDHGAENAARIIQQQLSGF